MNPHKFFRLARRPSVSLHSPATTLRLPLKITPFASFWCALSLFDPDQAHTNTAIKIKRVSHSFSQNTLIAKLFAEKTAIKTGKRLESEEQLQLVNQLFACKEMHLSPSNKRIFTTLEVSDLDKKLNE